MKINRPLLVPLLIATIFALVGCSPNPTPRGAAQQGVGTGDVRAQNAGYYLGADPDFRPRGKSGGP